MGRRFNRREFVRRTSLGGLGISAAALLKPVSNDAAFADPLHEAFLNPPDDARIMFRWWWFGAAVSQDELDREMREMKAAGAGGFEIQPVYPLVLDDPAKGIRNLPYLSDEFLEAVRFVNHRARELGLRCDLTGSSGWPFGGAHVPANQSAGQLRVVKVPVPRDLDWVKSPALENGESLLAAWAVEDVSGFSGDGVRELSVSAGSEISLSDAPHAKAVIFFISSRTGQLVKRAAVGAEGFVIDHYDRASVQAYLDSTLARLMEAFGSSPPFAIFSDSLEVYASNWTPSLLEEFRRRRGYDLMPHLLSLAGDAGPDTSAVRCDWGRTLTELVNENYLTLLHEWAQQRKTKLRSQTYGIPPVSLSSNRLVDLPEGEGADWKTLSTARWASSASHLYGKNVTSSETWTWIHSPAFRATPLDLKVEADRHFLQGINQIVGHGWPYSPDFAGEPGWTFYAAGALNAHNPWWPVMPELALYLQRISFLLRQGNPANDVGIYLSNADAWSRFTTSGNPSINQVLAEHLDSKIFSAVLEAGFNFDFIDDDAINLVGIPFRAVILPEVEHIPLAVYQKLEEYAVRGGVLLAVGRKPETAPGLLEGNRDSAKVRDLTRKLFENTGAPGLFINDVSVFGTTLSQKLVPDVNLSPGDPEIGFIHRKADSTEIYFIANTSNQSKRTQATFRVTNLSPERWDPFTGRNSSQEWKTNRDGMIEMSLELAAYESAVYVFTPSRVPAAIHRPNSKQVHGQLDLSAGWRLSFPGLKKTLQIDQLKSWTDYSDTRHYSGSGVYEKKINVPSGWIGQGRRVQLSLGQETAVQPITRVRGLRAWIDSPVREAAIVYVNGQRAGSIWRPPYELDVTSWLRPGENDLRIEVFNLAINSMAGQSLPDYRLLESRYGRRFSPQDLEAVEPLPSGLLGPVALKAY